MAIHFGTVAAGLLIAAVFVSDPYWFVVCGVIALVVAAVNFLADREA